MPNLSLFVLFQNLKIFLHQNKRLCFKPCQKCCVFIWTPGILFDFRGYALLDTFYIIEIQLLVFKLYPVISSKLRSGCSSEWKSESP